VVRRASARVVSSAAAVMRPARLTAADALFAALERAPLRTDAQKRRSAALMGYPWSFGANATPAAAAAGWRALVNPPEASKPASVSAAALPPVFPRVLRAHGVILCLVCGGRRECLLRLPFRSQCVQQATADRDDSAVFAAQLRQLADSYCGATHHDGAEVDATLRSSLPARGWPWPDAPSELLEPVSVAASAGGPSCDFRLRSEYTRNAAN
jgi:hypothetical protein